MAETIRQIFGSQFQVSSSINGATVNLSNLDVQYGSVFSNWEFHKCNFRGKIAGLSCAGSIFFSCNFALEGAVNNELPAVKSVNAQHALFHACEISIEGKMTTSFFDHAQFTDCIITGLEAVSCDFVGTRFFGCTFRSCMFSHSILEDSIFENCSFQSCELRNLSFDYSTFALCAFENCIFSARQTMHSFGAKELLEADGLQFSAAGQETKTGAQLREELDSYLDNVDITTAQSEMGFFALINAMIVTGRDKKYNSVLKSAFMNLAGRGHYREIELLAKLMDYVPQEKLDENIRSSLYQILVSDAEGFSKSANGSALNTMRLAGAFDSIERIRELLQVRYGNRQYATIEIGTGASSDDESKNLQLRDTLIDAFEKAGIKYELEVSKNSPLLALLTALFCHDQLMTVLHILAQNLPGFLDWANSTLLSSSSGEMLHDTINFAESVGAGLVANYIGSEIQQRSPQKTSRKNKTSQKSTSFNLDLGKKLFHLRVSYEKEIVSEEQETQHDDTSK